jgi:O-antigen ligase
MNIRPQISSNFLLYLVGFLFLIPSIEPRLLDLSLLSSFKYVLLVIGLLFNLAYLLYSRKKLHISFSEKLVFLFLLILFITLPLSSSFVDSSMRVFSVVLVLLFLSTQKQINHSFFESLLTFSYMTAIFTVAVSIPMHFIIGELFNDSGNFSGVYYNANILGMICVLLCMPSVLFYFHSKESKHPKAKFIINGLLILSLIYLILLSRSRAALLSLFVLLFVFYFFSSKSLVKYILKLFVIFIVVTLFVLVFTSADQKSAFMSKYVFKYETSNSLSSVASTRLEVYATRFQSIDMKPIFGWGYGINPAKTSPLIDDPGNGDTEKGNSILALFEEFGVLIGAIITMILVLIISNTIIVFNKATKVEVRKRLSLSIAILFAGFVHSNFESWVFYFGNVITLFYWAVILSISSSKNTYRKSY